jgi:benzodiazapine receptor
MEIASIIGLACFIAACFLAALMGALFRPGDWYERLKKPSWRPPNRLFAPVWTALYLDTRKNPRGFEAVVIH